MDFLSNLLRFSGAFLQLALLVLILRGPLRLYFPVFLYVFSSIAATAAEEYVIAKWGVDLEHYFPVYWGSEIFLDLVMFLVMVSLTLHALEGNPLRAKVMRMLGIGFVVILVIPFVAFEGGVYSTRWNGSTSQLLNFGAAVANLVLWGALLIKRPRDPQLMMVTVGLGVVLASSAATLGMRTLTSEDTFGRTFADYAHRFLQVAGTFILCWAFWRKNKAVAATTV